MKADSIVKEVLADVLGRSSDGINLDEKIADLGLTDSQKEEVVEYLDDEGLAFPIGGWANMNIVRDIVSAVALEEEIDESEEDDTDDWEDDTDDWEDDDDDDDDVDDDVDDDEDDGVDDDD